MSQLSKQQLKVENNTEFPNNNTGQITPTRLRTFNEDMIDSTVNQTSFDSFSGSVASQFASVTASSAITASSLITASFASQTLTFTKGDGSTFGIVIPDVSGSTIDTGSFVTTASFNDYTQSTNSSISQLNASSASQQISINNLNTSASLSVITASFDNGTRNLTFTKGDASTFAVNIPDVSGSTLNTGSFATTGSNVFVGDQTITGSLNVSASTYQATINLKTPGTFFGGPTFQLGGNLEAATFSNLNDFIVNFSGDAKFFGDSILIQGDDARLILNDTSIPAYSSYAIRSKSEQLQFIDAANDGVMVSVTTASVNIVSASFSASLQQGYTWVGDANGRTALVATSSFGGGGSINTGSFATTGSNNFIGVETINSIAGTSVGEVYLLGRSGSLILGNSTATPTYAALTHLSSSQINANTNLIFKTNSNAGSTIISGSLNIFSNGSVPAAGRLNYLENSNIFLNESGFLPTVTASVLTAGGFYPRMRNNMWLGTGPWTINTNAVASSSVQAGSYNNNLFLGSTGTTINSLGNTSGPSFSHNIVAQAAITINAPSRSLAQVAAGDSGSTVVSFLNNAAFGGTITYNGPVSASSAQQHTISGNSVQGTLALNLQSGSRGYTISNNILNGTLTVNDNIAFTPTLGANSTISQTNINGAITLTNRASASFNLTANNLGGFTITNEYDSSTNGTAGRSFVFQGNVILGFLANNIYFSGSAAGTNSANERGRGFYGNLIGGSRISASVIGDGNRHFLASAVWGQGLSVYGTGLYDASNATLAGGQNGGSAFFGRWNAEDGNRALTAQTVFAVGTGNSGSAGIVRKTGFLIDSGSNTFVEGTLNVSGSSTLSGSLYIQSGSTLPVSTGSAILTWDATTGQVKQASFNTIVSASVSSAEFWSTTTQSGSGGVSGSIQFNNSGSFYNISLVNGTQLTVGNAGVYNIQFSAQIETSAGADTVYMWFKKNGTNIGDSASKAVLANNTAQIMTVNILDQAVANDYYEIAYQNLNGHATVLAEAASGNIPAIPSVIATVFQIR
jgi:hypothetical protein